jgi:enoyl-CoA hydratase
MIPKFETVDVQIDGYVAEITLNRPDANNAINDVLHLELAEAFNAVRAEPGIRAIVLAGNGRHFSAGGDFDMILAVRNDPVVRARTRAEARPLLVSIADCPIPVVAALQGGAVGLGATVLLGADAVVAARNARISDPHVVIGVAAGDGGCVLWPAHAGLLRAKRYLLTGDRLTAEDAHVMGLVTDLVDTPEEVIGAARKLAGRIAALPPLAVQATKRALNQLFRNRLEEVFDIAFLAEIETLQTEDVVEAISSFRERRKPDYKGI